MIQTFIWNVWLLLQIWFNINSFYLITKGEKLTLVINSVLQFNYLFYVAVIIVIRLKLAALSWSRLINIENNILIIFFAAWPNRAVNAINPNE